MSSDRIAIDELKQQWLHDPCWDIEDTEGFESQRDELLAFRLSHEAKWRAEAEADEVHATARARTFGRQPVGVAGGVVPMVVCRDGSVWQLTGIGAILHDAEEEGEQVVRSPGVWEALPPIPGSPADLTQKGGQ